MPDAPAQQTAIEVGCKVKVKARPDYLAVVTWCSDQPEDKATVEPLPGQGVTSRRRTVWQDRLKLADV